MIVQDKLLMKFCNQVPKSIRPRERLRLYGVKALSNQELLSVLLRTGSKKEHVMEVALHLLNQFENLHELKEATVEELQKINGIGEVKALEMKAAIELGCRIAGSNQLKLGKVSSSKQIAKSMMYELKDLKQEHLIALYLNVKNELLKKETIYIGSLNQIIAHPREIFKGAVRCSAAQIILVHNHPSGNPTPSANDILFTRRIFSCGKMMGIELLDHLIVGPKSYISLKERGECEE